MAPPSERSRPGDPDTVWESIKVEGRQLAAVVGRLIREGNVRHIIVRQNDRVLVEFPLSIGLAGLALAPVFAMLGAAAVMVKDCTIDVERQVQPKPPAAAPGPSPDQ